MINCYECKRELKRSSEMTFIPLLGDYVCDCCFADLQVHCQEGKAFCEDCGELVDEHDLENISEDNNIPYDYICSDCLCNWADFFADIETKESMNRNKQI